MLLPSRTESHLFTPIFTSEVPKEVGVHAVRRTKNGKADSSAELYAHWNGIRWGSISLSPKLARPADGRGRVRIDPLEHCVRWHAVTSKQEKVKASQPQAGAKSKGALHTILHGAAPTKNTGSTPKASRKAASGPRLDIVPSTKRAPKPPAPPLDRATATASVSQVCACILELLSDKKVHHIDAILNHVHEGLGSLGAKSRSLIDSALTVMIRSGEVLGKAGLIGASHEMFFLVPIEGDEPLLPSADDSVIAEATMKTMLPLMAASRPVAVAPVPAPVSIQSPAPASVAVQAVEPAAVFRPRAHGQVVSPVMINKILDAVQLGILSRGPLAFGRLMDDLDIMNVDLGISGEALSTSLRAGILRGQLELTDKFSGQEMRYTVAQFGESVPVDWVADPVDPAALLHELLEILFVSDKLEPTALTRRASNLFPRNLVTIDDVHAAMAQGIAAGIAFCDGTHYSLKAGQAKPTFELTEAGVTIRAGAIKIELDDESTSELTARLQVRNRAH